MAAVQTQYETVLEQRTRALQQANTDKTELAKRLAQQTDVRYSAPALHYRDDAVNTHGSSLGARRYEQRSVSATTRLASWNASWP
jgi:hypothetical protein